MTFHVAVSYFYPRSICLFRSSFTVILNHFSYPIKIRHVKHVLYIIVCIQRKSYTNFQLRHFCTHRSPLLPPCIISTLNVMPKMLVPICWNALLNMLLMFFTQLFWESRLFILVDCTQIYFNRGSGRCYWYTLFYFLDPHLGS